MVQSDLYFYLNAFSAIAILSSAIIPFLLSAHLGGRIRQLTLILGVFILVHGSFHIAVVFGYEFLGAGIFDPLSVVILIFFGLFYLKLILQNERGKTRRVVKKL